MMNTNSSLQEIVKVLAKLIDEKVEESVQRRTSLPPAEIDTKSDESVPVVRRTSKPPRMRRTDAEVDRMVAAISAVVAAHAIDGIGSAGIRDVLRKNKFELAHPLRLAVQKGLVVQRGAKKGARYYAPVSGSLSS